MCRADSGPKTESPLSLQALMKPGFRSCGSRVGSVLPGQVGFWGCFGVGGVCLPCRWGLLGVFGLVSVGLR